MPTIIKRCGLAVCFFLCVSSFQALQAQEPRERHARIRAAIDSKDNAAATAELQSLLKADPALFALNNYDYLLGRLSERRGDMATAASSFQAVVARNSLLSQYALWHLAQFARSIGNLTLEREQLRQLILTTPSSLLREAATARLGESFFESGDYNSAIQTLKPNSDAKGSAAKREALALVGQAYLRAGQAAAAREVFNSLLAQTPDAARPDDYALAGVRGLDLLDSGSPEAAQKQAPQLSESEHQRRAAVYTFNRDFAGARLHYLALVERYPQSASVPDALFQTGRGYAQDVQFNEAINYFQRIVKEFPNSAIARDALSSLASAYLRGKRADEAATAFKQLIERHSGAPNPERYYLNLIDALREAGRDEEALSWVRQTREKFKGQTSAIALFSQTRIHLSQGDWQAALADLDALKGEADTGGMRAAGGTTPTEISFLRAYTLEQLGRFEEALGAYLSLPDGRNEYYGGRATRRLRALAADARAKNIIQSRLDSLRAEAQQALSGGQAERARTAAQSALRLTEDAAATEQLLDIARRAYSSLPAYNRIPTFRFLPVGRQEVITDKARQSSAQALTHQALADELLFLGLYDEGAPELAVAENAFTRPSAQAETKPAANDEADKAQEKTTQPAPSSSTALSSDAAYTLAVLFKRGEKADHAIRFAEPLWKKVPADYLLELAPREMVELLYPAPYVDALREYAPARGVDPRFVLAIMRQESRFRADAKSVSAARGLLQFIPTTANKIAAELGLQDFRQDELYNPRIAVLFGSQYMGNLFKLFPNMPQAVAASYNGGEDNVARWVARARSEDPDRYTIEVGFTQSKDYVFKVLPNYWVYQKLYNDQLQPR
ncbi:MAG TPA: transglycosylase SLT domain-containing protein [Pyrinomonadaceae bacterium]|jgi:soluble lytic murein transglycosylase